MNKIIVSLVCCFTLLALTGCEDKPKPNPGPTTQACGGITGAKCPDNQMCVDDPTDSCDPAKGGADCAGTCK